MKDTWNMTPDEAKIYILQNWFDGDENVNAFVCGDREYTAMAIAVEALEALEATKWHYPSRGELPDPGSEVWDGYKIIYYLPDLEKWYRFEDDEHIKAPYAWCYLPESPEEEA